MCSDLTVWLALLERSLSMEIEYEIVWLVTGTGRLQELAVSAVKPRMQATTVSAHVTLSSLHVLYIRCSYANI